MKVSANILEKLNNSITNSNESKNTNIGENNTFNSIFTSQNISDNTKKSTTDASLDVFSEIKNKKDTRENKTESNNKKDKSNFSDKKKSNEVDKNDEVKKSNKSKTKKVIDEKEIEKAKTNDVLSKIAGFLGITLEELQAQMQEMGITEESFTSMEGVRNAILELTGLTDATELLSLKGIKNLFSDIDNVLTMSDADIEQLLASNEELIKNFTEVVEQEVQATTETEVETEVDTQEVVETMATDVKPTNEAVASNVKQAVAPELNNTQQTNATQNLTNEQVAVSQEDIADDVPVDVANNKVLEMMETLNEEALQVNTTQGQSQGEMGQSSSQNGSENQNANSNANNNSNVNNVMNNILFTQDIKAQATTFNSIISNRMQQPLNEADIINQIVEKMKFTVDGETAEVNITLRPQHLGDVTLKIATLNGVVTAEFLAESEQVKALIESNFQDLQEMLRQRGLEVAGFTTGLLSDQRDSNSGSNNNKSKNGTKNTIGLVEDEQEEVQEQEIKISNYDYRA